MKQKAFNAALALSVLVGSSFVADQANALAILTFGQVGNGNPIVGTATTTTTPGSTTITALNTAITISQIDAAIAVPTPAFLDINLSSSGPATNALGGITQNFSGTFSITSLTGDHGTNYLSGSLIDVAFGSNTAFTLTASTPPAGAVTFTSDVITDLALDRGASLSFANVTPGLSITDSTIASFTSSVSGTFSAQPPTKIPEPASLALLGAGLFGLGMIRSRRSNG